MTVDDVKRRLLRDGEAELLEAVEALEAELSSYRILVADMLACFDAMAHRDFAACWPQWETYVKRAEELLS